ncbi:hypothetical protein ACCO45_002247 [Purpureocillium lilacinum]|uniref:Uncharacterized protein n=1 Tax=Purpureocillium lilacinum TaxID=33203 RepID=A0ACC4EC07_PURLI
MALLRIRLTPDPWATTPLTSDRSWEVMTRDDEDALEAFFTWLKGRKGVTTILKLVVMENQDRPCSERVVRECLKGLDVRYLDWKRRDICVDTLLVVPNIVELWLYSSGLNAVLCGWSDEHGLGRFTKGFEAEDVRKDNMKVFERRLLKWHEIKKSKIVPEISITPEPDRQDTIDTNDNMTKKNSAAHLLEAVRKASNANILMYCAASNTKATTKSNDPYFPGGFNEVTAIGAADWDQIRKPYVGGDADYLFPGDYVLNGPDGKPTKEGRQLGRYSPGGSGEEIRTPARTGMGKVFGDLLRVSGETVNFVDIKNLVSQNSDKSWPSHKAVVDRAQSLIAGSTESKTRKTR